MTSWYIEKGPECDVVLSSRIRLARNFKDYPFPFQMNAEQGEKVLSKVRSTIFEGNGAMVREFLFVEMQDLSPIDRQSMVEKHLISPNLAEDHRNNAAIISKDEKLSVMVNEEDHLRIQSLFPGMQVDSAWKLCQKIDVLLEEKIDFAFDNKYGYLTCCPTNIGTGIRASVMMHLPALTMTGYMRNILEACGKLGIAVRGLYGENTEAHGNIFQISNQLTLGQTEEEIITSVTNIAFQIIEQERLMRRELYRQNPIKFEDKVFRSLGIFTNARIITSDESLRLLSDVRLGVNMGIIKDIKIETLNEIMILIQPANLQKLVGKPLSSEERDVKRAEIIRQRIGIVQ